jgi:hypothetical protein
MSDYGPQVKLARLYEKTSKTGNQYFVGRLGMAKIAVLKLRTARRCGLALIVGGCLRALSRLVRQKATPVDVSASGARLDALRNELGIETRTKGKEVFFVGLRLAS